MGKYWAAGREWVVVGGGGRSRVAAETVQMQKNAEWGLVKRGRGEVVQRCSGAWWNQPWKAREGGRGEMTELAGRCWLVLAGAMVQWCSAAADSRR
jgi:hypothetical protein